MRVLVTGATSGLGRNAAQYLLERGITVIATGRNLAAGAQLERAGATFIPCDLISASQSECMSLMNHCDAVWHCAAKSSPWGSRASFWQANAEVTRKLALIAGLLGVPRFIHISTPAVYFDFQHHHFLPESYLARTFSSHYASSKYAAERAIHDAVSRFTATTYVILRPRGLFGPHDSVIVPRLMQQLQRDGGVLRLPRGGEAMLDLTFVENVVYALYLATQHKTLCSGSIYNVTNHQPRRLVDMLDGLLRQQLGLSYTIQSVPWTALSLAARGMMIVGKCLNKEPPVTRYSAGTVCFDMTLSAQKAIDELGYRPPVSLDDGMVLTAEWLRTNGNNYRV